MNIRSPGVNETKQKRSFRIDPAAIMSLIGNQASGLHKAMMEGVANAIDAGASRVDIQMSANQVSIKDDGSGLSEGGILKHFEVFGFDHAGMDKTHGRFGIGRGQMFWFGVNRWLTGPFAMSVDIKSSGLDYELSAGHEPVSGVTIDIDLYEPLSQVALRRAHDELVSLIKYAPVDCFINGKKVTRDPSMQKDWTRQTDHAWIRLNKGSALAVYSQGLLVEEMPSYRYGVGGEIVTKPGQPLLQNMARNSVITERCQIWKAIDKTLRREAQAIIGKETKSGGLTDAMSQSLAQQIDDPDQCLTVLMEHPLFTLTTGRSLTLRKLLDYRSVIVAPRHCHKADKIMQRRRARAITPETLERFGVDSLEDLRQRLTLAIENAVAALPRDASQKNDWSLRLGRDTLDMIADTRFSETVGSLKNIWNIAFEQVDRKSMRPSERHALRHVRRMSNYVPRIMAKVLSDDRPLAPRHVEIMNSDLMAGCTDGTDQIWLDRRELKQVARGISGFLRLAHLLTHEYLHHDDSSAGHQHDEAFYEAFHNVVLDPRMADMVVRVASSYAASNDQANLKQLRDLDTAMHFDPQSVEHVHANQDAVDADIPQTQEPTRSPVRRCSPGRKP